MSTIRRLIVQNLRSLHSLTVPGFARMNLIVGGNGEGKSTFKDALALLFTGTCLGAETGMGLATLRSSDGNPDQPWLIEAELERDGKVQTVGRTDEEGPKSNRQQAIEIFTGVHGSRAAACLLAGTFRGMDAKQRQRFLLDLAPRETVKLPPEISEAIQAHLNRRHAEVDLQTLEMLHQLAYSERTVAGRVAREFGDPVAPEPPEEFKDLAGKQPDEVRTRREKVVVKVGALRVERELALQKATPKTIDLAPYREAAAAAKRKLEEKERALSAMPTVETLSAKAADVAKRMQTAGETNRAIEQKRHDLAAGIAAAKDGIERARNAIAILEGAKARCCPVCESVLDTKARAAVKKKLQAQGDQDQQELQRLEGELNAYPGIVSVAAIEEEADRLRKTEDRRAQLEEDVRTATIEQAAAVAKLEDAQAQPQQEGDAAAAGEAEALRARIAEGDRRAEALAVYYGALNEYLANHEKRRAAIARHAQLDRLVEQLGPGGIRKALGGGGIAKLHDDLNAVLAPLGFLVDLSPVLDLQGAPLVQVDGGPWVPAREGFLSDSQLIRFDASFACAVATYTGLGIVVVDRYESLVGKSRPELWSVLAGSGHQCFVIGASDPASDFESKAARVNARGGDVRYFLLQGGQLVAPVGEAA